MLPLVIYEQNDNLRQRLHRFVSDFCYYRDTEIHLMDETASLEEVVKHIENLPGVIVLLLGVDTDRKRETNLNEISSVIRVGKQAQRKNPDNYTLYCLRDLADIEPLLNSGARPAGVLIAPFDAEKIEKALLRIEKDYSELMEEKTGNCLIVDSKNSTYRLPYSQILYIEALEKKINIWANRQCIKVRQTINTMEATLPPSIFLRCHRSYIVNRQAVEYVDFTEMLVYLKSGDSVPLSRSYKDILRSQLMQERNEKNAT